MTTTSMFKPTTGLQLRPYQAQAIDDIVLGWQKGHRRQILCLPTGSGKSEIAVQMMQKIAAAGKRAAFVCDRITLAQQFSQRLTQYGVLHGLAQGSSTFGRREPIQVCSAQTLEKRGFWPDLDLLIIDEAHTQRKATTEFTLRWGGHTVGLTATPMTQGLGKIYSKVINATTTNQLLADGWLAPLKMYAAEEIDMAGAGITAGEWRASEVRKRGSRIIGDIVSEWERMTNHELGGPAKTLLFSADVAHGRQLCDAFQQAGYDFRQSSYRDDGAATAAMVSGFERGDFTGLVSVEKFVKGFDVPDVKCIVGARPYRSSLAAVIQQMGRGMRRAPGKDFCLYLDHAGNCEGWLDEIYDFWADGISRLDTNDRKAAVRREGEKRRDTTCLDCGFIRPPGAHVCPACGAARKRRSPAQQSAGRMRSVTAQGSREWMQDRDWTWQQMCAVALRWKDGDMVAATKTARVQYKNLYGEWPDWNLDFKPTDGEPDSRVVRKMHRQLKQWIATQKPRRARRGGRRRMR